MIHYAPLLKTLQAKGMSVYELVQYGISTNTIHRIRHGQPISFKTLDTLCFYLECAIPDIITYEYSEE